jgi:hypothetical protein
MALSACGGGGGVDVASIPPPPPAPPPPQEGTATVDVQTAWLNSPATRPGKYDLIGRLISNDTSQRIAPGDFKILVSRDVDGHPTSYTLDASTGVLPGGLTSVAVTAYGNSWTINLNPPSWTSDDYPFGGDYTQYFGQRFTAFSKPADGGAETKLFSYDLTRDTSVGYVLLDDNRQLKSTLDYDTGYSYVAMGEWSWQVLDVNGNPAGESGRLLFVNGDRTPVSGIPMSGTATYDARTLGAMSNSSIPFSLTADFGQRSISTEISQDSVFDVSGSAPFSNDGSFDIPLNGTAGTQAATGTMDGAFFGPHAEQVGGTFAVGPAGGAILVQDAFVGQQQPH